MEVDKSPACKGNGHFHVSYSECIPVPHPNNQRKELRCRRSDWYQLLRNNLSVSELGGPQDLDLHLHPGDPC